MRQISILVFLFISICLVYSLPPPSTQTATAYYDPLYGFTVKLNVLDSTFGCAYGTFGESRSVNGWQQLNITSNPELSDEVQMSCAGYLEGYVTQSSIYEFYQNQYYEWHFPTAEESWHKLSSKEARQELRLKAIPPRILQWMSDNLQWMKVQAYSESIFSEYWRQVLLIVMQFQGLVQGYADAVTSPKEELSEIELYFLNAAGDLEDLIPALTEAYTTSQTWVQGMKRRVKNNRNDIIITDADPLTDCSALIKITDNDVFVGHITWRGFHLINKTFKRYHFAVTGAPATSVVFASSPGFLSSKDDWYLMSSGLVSLETTNSVFNKTLYNALKPETLLCFVRSILANRMAQNSSHWVDIFAENNSGSYNNQWMVLDYNKISRQQNGIKIGDQALWILEQIPGYTEKADVTDILKKQGFWSSYNVPYFQSIFNMSGYPAQVAQYGDDYSYNNCSRANIFRREQANVNDDWKTFAKVLQFNQWQTDAFSKGDSAKSIAARYDLRDPSLKLRRVPFGGMDCKLTSIDKAKKLEAFAKAGPTSQDQPAFSWNDWSNTTIIHNGQPDTWNFDFVDFTLK